MPAVSSGVTPWGGASSRRLPGSIPAGYVSQTGYQYDSISRVAGHRELAPPSKFLKLGGFSSNVFIAEVNTTSSWNIGWHSPPYKGGVARSAGVVACTVT